jgi:FAD/FMN-containing dehydrogenase
MPGDSSPSRIADAIARLTAALGPKGVSTDAHEIAPHVQDWRGRWKGSTPVLVKPSSTDETANALSICAELGLAVTPQGGNSGLVNGGVPHGEAA